jgi:2-amino-4-hydroxy-6-hydroxymethyldihydropteridine diphosphokinase
MDIDLALYDDFVGRDGDAEVPHPRLTERAFVLQPLLDLDPDLVHPATGERLSGLLLRLGSPDLRQVGANGWHEAYMPIGARP